MACDACKDVGLRVTNPHSQASRVGEAGALQVGACVRTRACVRVRAWRESSRWAFSRKKSVTELAVNVIAYLHA